MKVRPPTVAEMLDHIAAHLDASDVIVNRYAEAVGHPPPCYGDEVQSDLRMLAVWLREHPKTDAAMYDHLPSVSSPENSPA